MNDTKIRVLAALEGLDRFTVMELCDRAGLRRTQVDPVLSALKKARFVLDEGAESFGEAHRPSGTCRVNPDPDKRQELANQLFGLKKALAPQHGAEDVASDLEIIGGELDGLDLLLDICDRATRNEPLEKHELQRVETRIDLMYRRLEMATYSAGLDLRSPANQDHPLAKQWNRWHQSTERAHRIIGRWQSQEPVLGTKGVSTRTTDLVNAPGLKQIEIVTDPHFLDSAIFFWIFSGQPFLTAGMELECKLIAVDWKDVPARVGESKHALGFYNRRANEHSAMTGPGYWADLCVYSGYALLAHRDSGIPHAPNSLQQAEEMLENLVQMQRTLKKKPRIIAFGADSQWRVGPYLTDNTPTSNFDWEIIPNPNEALAEFFKDPSALFIGGLPQRLRAEREGHIRILDAGFRPRWFSINGLIHSRELSGSARTVLQKAVAFWYSAVEQLKTDRAFRNQAFQSVQQILAENFGIGENLFEDWMLDRVFGNHGSLEFFPSKPADITHEILKHVEDSVRVLKGRDKEYRLSELQILLGDVRKMVTDTSDLPRTPVISTQKWSN